jgi:signal transduction histidine kinase/CheY-like chemotaxis protein
MTLSSFGRHLLTLAAADAIDTEATKSDFVSSLSHELRSPLHGCLGAVEVLRDTALDKSQKELLGMIDSCASTLLFTMNHLLDFSKINDLDRTQSRHRGDSYGETSLAPPRNTFGQVSEDYLCRIVQSVVEGVWYGHDREQAAHERGSNAFLQDHDLHLDSDSPIVKNKDVAIFLFMESHAAWFSMVSAGAWKRLVMNLFGNSLKFCQCGYIEVTLKMVPDPKNPGKKMAHLMVSDTGIGMSENFMKHALYRPFMQENSLVSGTGVGLNIVKQIVNDLQGTISVTSTLGVGTRFDVFIPLVERKSISGEAIPDGGEILDPEAVLSGRTLCLLPSSHTTSGSTDTPLERTTMVHSYVKSIAENWFQMKVISADTAGEVDADIYVAEVSDYASHACATSESSDMADRHRTILVGNQREISQTQQQYSNDFVDLRYPLGPRSLSLALHTAMKTRINQAAQILTDPATASSPERIEEIVEIKAVSHELERVLGDPAHSTETEHLLLVDDNAINLKILSTFVKKLSFAARTAVDGEDAFETYKQFSKTQPFTTILMDISMPKMNGFESSRAIRQFEVENGLLPSRIVALTALGSEASRREAEASGIDEFQTKPVALRTLKELLQSAS